MLQVAALGSAEPRPDSSPVVARHAPRVHDGEGAGVCCQKKDWAPHSFPTVCPGVCMHLLLAMSQARALQTLVQPLVVLTPRQACTSGSEA